MKKNYIYIILLLLLMLIPVRVRAYDVSSACYLWCFTTGDNTNSCRENCSNIANQNINQISDTCSYVCGNDNNCITDCTEEYISEGNFNQCDTSCINDFLKKFLITYKNNNSSLSANIGSHCMRSCNNDYTCVPSCVENVRTNCTNVCNNSKDSFCINECILDYSNSSYYCLDNGCDSDFYNKYQNSREYQNSSNTSNNSSSGSVTTDDSSVDKTPLTCEDVKYVTFAYNTLRILAPLLLMIYGSLDFFKAITAGDVKKQQEARSKFPKRIIAFLLLIILPFVVGYLFKVFGKFGSSNLSTFCCVATNGSEDCNVINDSSSNQNSNNTSTKNSNKSK